MNKEEEVCVNEIIICVSLSWSFDFKVVVVGDGRWADPDGREHCSLSIYLSLSLSWYIASLLGSLTHFILSICECCLHFDFFSSTFTYLLQRKKGFKKSIDIDEGRRRREETTLQIRKTKKDVRLAKRRQMPSSAMGMEGGGMGGMDTPAALAAASMLAAGGVAPGGYGE